MLRLTAKLKSSSGQIELLCPLCLGPWDKINNLLEVGSTISKIIRNDNNSDDDRRIVVKLNAD